MEYGDERDWLLCLGIAILLGARLPMPNLDGHSQRYWHRHPEAKARAEAAMVKRDSVSMPSDSHAKEWKTLWVGVSWGASVTAWAAVVAISSPEFSVPVLIGIGAIGFNIIVIFHGLLKTNKWWKTAARVVIFETVIALPCLGLWKLTWPTVRVSRSELLFTQNPVTAGETYYLTITNEKPIEVYDMNVSIDSHDTPIDEFVIDIDPDSRYALEPGKKVNGLTLADIKGFKCGDNIFYLNIFRLKPHESREITLRHTKNSAAEVSSEVYLFFERSGKKYVQPNKDITNFFAGSRPCSAPPTFMPFYY